jgi:hypothetical protein
VCLPARFEMVSIVCMSSAGPRRIASLLMHMPRSGVSYAPSAPSAKESGKESISGIVVANGVMSGFHISRGHQLVSWSQMWA